jgi:four helix bundle protein
VANRPILSFHDLEVWQEGVALALECYQLTAVFPAAERYGLTAQIRKAGVSIPSNIAEGHNRKDTGPYLNHVRIALGSEAELETQLLIALRLGFCPHQPFRNISNRRATVGRMLHALAASLKERLAREKAAGPRRGVAK